MANSISGNGGVDTSELKEIRDSLIEALNTQKSINNMTVKPKGDASGLKPIRKGLDTIREEVAEIGASDIELWNAKTIQRGVSDAKKELEKLSKSTRGFQEEFRDEFQVKKFIESFQTLKTYGARFGKDLTSEYQQAFDSLMNNIKSSFNSNDIFGRGKYLGFSPDSINALIEKANKSAKNTLDVDINYALDFDVSKARKAQYDEERRLAIESANAVEEAERQKRKSMLETRDTLIGNIKTRLESINTAAKDGEFLDIDADAFGKFQKQAGDLLITLENMGYETKDLQDLLDSIQNKVYVPKNVLSSIGSTSKSESEEVEKLNNEIARLQLLLSQSVDIKDFDKLQEDLESAYHTINYLYSSLDKYRNSSGLYHTSEEYDDLAARSFEWMHSLEETKKKLDELQLKYDLLRKNKEEINKNDKVVNSSEILDSQSVDNYIELLQQIKQTLEDISNVLGKVDDNNGFTNIISSVDTLLTKLDEMYQKIGTGTYNIQVNQGVDKTAQENIAATSDYIKSTRSRYSNAYSKVVSVAGGEERLFAYINNAIDFKGGIDELYKTFGSSNISQIESAETQIYRYMDFFKVLRQAMSSGEFGLNLSGIRLPSDNDQNFRRQLKEKSGVNKSGEEILDLDEDKINLTEILDKLGEIRDILNDISNKNLFGDSFEKLSSQLDGIVEKLQLVTSNVKIVNDRPIETSDWAVEYSVDKTREKIEAVTEAQKELNEAIKESKNIESANDDSKEILEKTNAIEAEGEAAQKASLEKQEFVKANQKVSESGINTSESIKEASKSIEEEGIRAEKSKAKINEMSDAFEGWIRRQSGVGDSNTDSYIEALGYVEDLRHTDDGDIRTVNYDKLAKRIIKADTDIYKLQQDINEAQGDTSGLQDNLRYLERMRDTYLELFDYMIQNPDYDINSSQRSILDRQRQDNLTWLENVQYTKESIQAEKDLRKDATLSLDKEIKLNELNEYCNTLRELGLITPTVQQEINNLLTTLATADINTGGLTDYNKMLRLFQQDNSSDVENARTRALQDQRDAYEQLANNVSRYVELRKRIASGKAFQDDINEANMLEGVITSLTTSLRSSNVLFSETMEHNALKKLDTLPDILRDITNQINSTSDVVESKFNKGLTKAESNLSNL